MPHYEVEVLEPAGPEALARSTFWGMSRWQAKLEQRQAWLGRIVDIGCASGGLLVKAGLDPRLHESDLIGVEALHAGFLKLRRGQDV